MMRVVDLRCEGQFDVSDFSPLKEAVQFLQLYGRQKLNGIFFQPKTVDVAVLRISKLSL